MTEFESRQVMDQSVFVATADSLLAHARKGDTSFAKAMESAQDISTQLDEIKNNRLTIEPPLGDEQYIYYRHESDTILLIGQKATKDLLDNQRMSRRQRKAAERAAATAAAYEEVTARTASAFAGQGSSVKS